MANENHDVYPVPNQGEAQIVKKDIDTIDEDDIKVVAQGEKAKVPDTSTDEEEVIVIDDLTDMVIDDKDLEEGYMELNDLA